MLAQAATFQTKPFMLSTVVHTLSPVSGQDAAAGTHHALEGTAKEFAYNNIMKYE